MEEEKVTTTTIAISETEIFELIEKYIKSKLGIDISDCGVYVNHLALRKGSHVNIGTVIKKEVQP